MRLRARWIVIALVLLAAVYGAIPLRAVQDNDPTSVSERRSIPAVFGYRGSADGVLKEADFPARITRLDSFKRWLWRYRILADPEDPAPDIEGSRLRAWRQLESLAKAKGVGAASSEVSAASMTSGWYNLGPAPVSNWNNAQIRVSGQLTDIAVHPTDNNTWLIATQNGGVWRGVFNPSNNTTAWTPLTDSQATLAVGAVAYAKSNPNIIYAGTGSYVGYLGLGILKSTDGGNAWTLLAETTLKGKLFYEIRVNYTNPNNVVAATSGGLYRSTDGGITWTLANILPGTTPFTGFVTDLEVHPTDFQKQYAAVKEPDNRDGIYRSLDGGQNWTLVPGKDAMGVTLWASDASDNIGRTELAVAVDNPSVMYVGIAQGGSLFGLFKTTGAWNAAPTPVSFSVVPLGSPPYCTNQCDFAHELIVNPTDSRRILAGGVELWRGVDNSNGTWTWTEVTRAGQVGGIHVDQQTMAWAGSRALVGNDGGIWSTTNEGAAWLTHNDGLYITQFDHGSLHPDSVEGALGGGAHNGSSKRPNSGGVVWSHVGGGDGADNFFSSSNPDNKWAISSQVLGIERTKDGGLTKCNIGGSIPTSGENVPFVGSAKVCPNNDETVIVGTTHIWKTNNFFNTNCPGNPSVLPTWVYTCGTKPTPPATPPFGDVGDQTVAMDFARNDTQCRTYAYGSLGSAPKLRLTIDGGTSCTDLDPNSVLRGVGKPITELKLHPCFGINPSMASNTDTAYVTLGGSGANHIYRTVNRGVNWTAVGPVVNGTNFDVPFQALLLDPLIPEHIYAGSELGVWVSADNATNWQNVGVGQGVPYITILDLELTEKTNRVAAFSNGRSAFALDLIRCTGDCNGDGEVTVGELIRLTNINLGNQHICMCRIGDSNRNGVIAVNEQIEAQNNALNGCGAGMAGVAIGGFGAANDPVADAQFGAVKLTTARKELADRSERLTIGLTEDKAISAGLQFDLPFTGENGVPTCALDARIHETHELQADILKDDEGLATGSFRVIVMPSLKREMIAPLGNGPIVTCHVQRSLGMEKALGIENVLASDSDGREIFVDTEEVEDLSAGDN